MACNTNARQEMGGPPLSPRGIPQVPMCRILNKASHHGNVKLCWVRRIIEKKWYAHGCAQTPPRRRRPEIFKKLWLVPDTTKTRHEVLVVKNVVTALCANQTKLETWVCMTASTDHWCQTIRTIASWRKIFTEGQSKKWLLNHKSRRYCVNSFKRRNELSHAY